MHCTRCTDKYHVRCDPVNPLRVIYHEKLLRMMYIFFTIIVLLFTLMCMIVFVAAVRFAANATTADQLDALKVKMSLFKDPVDVRVWTAVLMGFYWLMAALVFIFSKRRFGGYKEIHVLPATDADSTMTLVDEHDSIDNEARSENDFDDDYELQTLTTVTVK